MSARYEAEVTLDVVGHDGDREVDYDVRAWVDVTLGPSGWIAEVDGDVEVYLERRNDWVPIEQLGGVTAKSIERAIDALCEAALEDDSASCVD